MIELEEGVAAGLVQGATVARIEVFWMHCVECGGHIQDAVSHAGR